MEEKNESGIKVKDIMLKPLMIEHDQSAKVAGNIMRKHRRYSLIVTKEDHPIGIITDSDMVKRLVAADKKPSTIAVGELMSKPIVTVAPNIDIIDAADVMKKNKIKRLPVMESGKITGIVELTDVAKASPEMIGLLKYKMQLRDAETDIIQSETSGICESCANYSESLKHSKDGQWTCPECTDENEDDDDVI
jgi:CBS domain-containing protein